MKKSTKDLSSPDKGACFFDYSLGSTPWLQVSNADMKSVGFQIPTNQYTAWADPQTQWVYLAHDHREYFLEMYCKVHQQIPEIVRKMQVDAPTSLLMYVWG